MSRQYTLAELRKHDGKDGGKVLVAVNGKVFDVTEKGGKFYGPGGPYEAFAGHDASRGLATMRMSDVKDEYDDLSGLNDRQQQSLERWAKMFQEKYEEVGVLVK